MKTMRHELKQRNLMRRHAFRGTLQGIDDLPRELCAILVKKSQLPAQTREVILGHVVKYHPHYRQVIYSYMRREQWDTIQKRVQGQRKQRETDALRKSWERLQKIMG